MKLKRYLHGLNLILLFLSASAFAQSNPSISNQIKPLPNLDWQPCYQEIFFDLVCAKLTVPLSYDDSKYNRVNRKTIQIALIKAPAKNPGKQKLGALIVNPGGPGGSGINFVRYGGAEISPAIREQYDVISFDPRGIGLSAPLTCGITPGQMIEKGLFGGLPRGADQEAARFKADQFINESCQQNANEIIDHMSTADVARDMDLLRQTLGEKLLNYIGYSYGSYLGVTYANLFPNNVGRFIVDGVLDPIEWSTGKGIDSWFTPVTTRLGSDKSSQAVLNEFFRLCDLAGTAGCGFAGNSAVRYKAILDDLKIHPRTVMTPYGFSQEFTYTEFLNVTRATLSNTYGWSFLVDFLLSLDGAATPEALGQKYAALQYELGYDVDTVPFDNFSLGFSGVLCSDSNNPIDPRIWPLAAKKADRDNGYLGALWTWESSLCAGWPGSQQSRYTGPFNHRTKTPVLVMSMLFDPATPYAGAQTVARLLPNSRLVSVAGWAHTTGHLSQCADSIVDSYLLGGTLPEPGTVCKQSYLPFMFPDGVDVFAGMPTDTRIDRDFHWHNLFDHDHDSDRKRFRRALIRSQIAH